MKKTVYLTAGCAVTAATDSAAPMYPIRTLKTSAGTKILIQTLLEKNIVILRAPVLFLPDPKTAVVCFLIPKNNAPFTR